VCCFIFSSTSTHSVLLCSLLHCLQIEEIRTLESHGRDTLVWHAMHKRIWPSAQRDTCMASHVRQLGEGAWIVVNESISHSLAETKVPPPTRTRTHTHTHTHTHT
jgi:hypothetical protein